MNMKFKINKKGLIGKILLGITILIVAIFLVLGITAYQASQVIKVVQEETTKIQTSYNLLAEQKDCTQINNIETSLGVIVSSVSGVCKNPILKFAISKVDAVPVKCENITQMKIDFESKFIEAKDYCENPEKYTQAIANGSMSEEELRAIAEKYNIKI